MHHLCRNIMHWTAPYLHNLFHPAPERAMPRISLWSQSFEVPTMTLNKQTVQHITSSTQTQRALNSKEMTVGENPSMLWGNLSCEVEFFLSFLYDLLFAGDSCRKDHPDFKNAWISVYKSIKHLMFVLFSWAREWFVGPLDIPMMHLLCYIKPMLLQNTRWTGRCQCCVWKGSRHSHSFWGFITSDLLALSNCGKSSNVRARGMLREGLKELKYRAIHIIWLNSDLASGVLWQSGVDRGEFLPCTTCFR